MQISDLVGQYNQASASGAETLTGTKGVENLVSSLRSLTKGNIFEGTVSSMKNGRVTLALSSGQQISARIEGMVGPERIDEINILQATYEAMRQAIGQLDPQPDLLLNDAVIIPKVEIRQVPIIKGDAKSISIGAASIIAKVTRDRLMENYEDIYPGYGFAANKGYGSAEHIAALKKLGPTLIHRATFIKNFV